jgi:hypothetical protein
VQDHPKATPDGAEAGEDEEACIDRHGILFEEARSAEHRPGARAGGAG